MELMSEESQATELQVEVRRRDQLLKVTNRIFLPVAALLGGIAGYNMAEISDKHDEQRLHNIQMYNHQIALELGGAATALSLMLDEHGPNTFSFIGRGAGEQRQICIGEYAVQEGEAFITALECTKAPINLREV